jgi:hypothetical protein
MGRYWLQSLKSLWITMCVIWKVVEKWHNPAGQENCVIFAKNQIKHKNQRVKTLT